MAAWPPPDAQPQDSNYNYSYWQPQPAFFWGAGGGPFHPSWPAFYPPPLGLGLGDHRGAAAAGPSQWPQQQGDHGQAQEWHNNNHHRRGGGGRYSSRRNQPFPQGQGPPPRNRNRSPPPRREEEEQEAAAAYGPDGSYIPPSRRQRRDTRHAIVAPPTPTYLAAAAAAANDAGPGTPDEQGEEDEPIALVMDLNHTLLCRAKRNRQASKMPVVRPYLATFLTYICTPRPSTLTPKFAPIVYSSARAPNVLSMLAALNLVPPARLAQLRFKHPYEPLPEQGDVLRMVFTREMMGLSERDYAGDVETVKDLGKVWERLGWAGSDDENNRDGVVDLAAADEHEDLGDDGQAPPPPLKKPKLNRKAKARLATRRDTIGARRTLLLDDEAGKAAQQPYSHLPIAPFLLHPSEIPDRAAAAVTLAAPPPPPPTPNTRGISSPPRNGRHSREPSPPPPPAAPGTPESAAFAPRPTTTTATASSSSYDPSAVALEVESHHPPAHDQHLLSTIWILERLSTEPNLAYAIKHGALDRLREEAKLAVELRKSGPGEGEEEVAVEEKEVEDEMAENGKKVCEELGIPVSREWVPDWRERLLASSSKLSHSPSQVDSDPAAAAAAASSSPQP